MNLYIATGFKFFIIVFFKHLNIESISISAGMFKGPTKLKTKLNIFTKGKLDYYKLDTKIPKYNRCPK